MMTVRVLIVDDHPELPRDGAAVARDRRASRSWARRPTARAGCARRASSAPDLVLLDVQLPDIDGFEVAAQLTAAGDGPAVVLTSSRDEADFGPLVAASGARGFVPKAELCGAVLLALLEPV